jgi:predicted acyl esterase
MARDDDVAVPMRDGVELLVDVHRPATAGRYPALVAASPYPRQIQDLGAPMGFIEAGQRTVTAITAGYLRASLREVDENASRPGAPTLPCRR